MLERDRSPAVEQTKATPIPLDDPTATVIRILETFPLRPQYKSEQADLQTHIEAELRAALSPDYEVIISVGGNGKPSIALCGTSFWPDAEIRSLEGPLIGIEVKYVRRGQSASKAIAETLGQTLIYRLRYNAVIAFILHEGVYNRRLCEHDERSEERLARNGIQLVLRRRQAAAVDAALLS